MLRQDGSASNLNGWLIHHEGRENEYPLHLTYIDHAQTMVIMSGPDAMQEANGRDEFPRTPHDVWDDDGDTAYLLNQDGELEDQRDCT